MSWDDLRLAGLSLPAKLLVTLLLVIIGPGYLFNNANIYWKHQDADGEPGLSIDDLRATFYGLEKTFKPEDKIIVNSDMLKQVRPGGEMREYLERGGEPAVRGLIKWLENAAKQEEFNQQGLAEPGDPSAREIIKAQCIECHNADGGDMEDIPYAATAESDPEYELVMATAKPVIKREEFGIQTITIKPTSTSKLIQVTHVHILTIPIFTFIVGVLFMQTGYRYAVKLLLGPLPLLAVILDVSGWWIARVYEPYIFVIAAAGALFAFSYGLQVLCILVSLWFGRSAAE